MTTSTEIRGGGLLQAIVRNSRLRFVLPLMIGLRGHRRRPTAQLVVDGFVVASGELPGRWTKRRVAEFAAMHPDQCE